LPTDRDIASFEQRIGLKLPAAYRGFLAALERPARYIDFREWEIRFFPLIADAAKPNESLEAPVNLDKKTYPFHRQLHGFLQYAPDGFENESGPELFDAASVKAAICIGEDVEGEPVVLAPTQHFSLWRFHHDGCQVERLARSFEDYLAACKPV
jgi:hypothetical protein